MRTTSTTEHQFRPSAGCTAVVSSPFAGVRLLRLLRAVTSAPAPSSAGHAADYTTRVPFGITGAPTISVSCCRWSRIPPGATPSKTRRCARDPGRLPPSRIRNVAAALVLLFLGTGGCTELTTGVDLGAHARLVIQANLAGTAARALVVEVSAADIPTTLIFNLPVERGVARGTVVLPAGSDRLLTARAYDARGVETHRASRTLQVRQGPNDAVGITLLPLQGDQPVEITVGSYSITLDLDAATVAAAETVQLTATVRAADDLPVNDAEVQWASLDPSAASVSATGLVTARAAGEARIVAVFAGVGAVARITVHEP